MSACLFATRSTLLYDVLHFTPFSGHSESDILFVLNTPSLTSLTSNCSTNSKQLYFRENMSLPFFFIKISIRISQKYFSLKKLMKRYKYVNNYYLYICEVGRQHANVIHDVPRRAFSWEWDKNVATTRLLCSYDPRGTDKLLEILRKSDVNSTRTCAVRSVQYWSKDFI